MSEGVRDAIGASCRVSVAEDRASQESAGSALIHLPAGAIPVTIRWSFSALPAGAYRKKLIRPRTRGGSSGPPPSFREFQSIGGSENAKSFKYSVPMGGDMDVLASWEMSGWPVEVLYKIETSPETSILRNTR